MAKIKITYQQAKLLKESAHRLREGWSSELHQATSRLLKLLYTNPTEIDNDPFWNQSGLSAQKIINYLSSTGLIIKNGDFYMLAKTINGRKLTPELAMNELEDSMRLLVKKTGVKSNDVSMNEVKRTMINYRVKAFNYDIAIIQDNSGKLYCFYWSEHSKGEFPPYHQIDAQTIEDYVNTNEASLTKGIGLKDFESGVDLVLIDDDLKTELMNVYDKSPSIMKALTPVTETTVAGASGTGGSSGPFAAPIGAPIKKKIAEGPVAGTSVDGGSTGPYDANAFGDIDRNGNFKKHKKSRAEKSTQWPSGEFVEFTDKQIGEPKNKTGKGSIISKSALHEMISGEIVSELGMNDWKVEKLMNYLNSVDSAEYGRCFELITNTRINKVRKPNDYLLKHIREMGKEDIDYVYGEVIGGE